MRCWSIFSRCAGEFSRPQHGRKHLDDLCGVRPEAHCQVDLIVKALHADDAKRNSTGRYRKWLEELRQVPTLRPYASAEEVAARLQKTNNPRLRDDRAAFWLNIGRKRTHKGNGNY